MLITHHHHNLQALGYAQVATPPLRMWSPIKEDQLIGYSAHWDTRGGMDMERHPSCGDWPRRSAAGRTSRDFGFTCHFFFENGTRTADRPARVHSCGRKGYFLLCLAKACLGDVHKGSRGGGRWRSCGVV